LNNKERKKERKECILGFDVSWELLSIYYLLIK